MPGAGTTPSWRIIPRSSRATQCTVYVSPLTVKTHLHHVYRNLGAESHTEALSRALRLLEVLG